MTTFTNESIQFGTLFLDGTSGALALTSNNDYGWDLWTDPTTNLSFLSPTGNHSVAVSWNTLTITAVWINASSQQCTWYIPPTLINGVQYEPPMFLQGQTNGSILMFQPNGSGGVEMGPCLSTFSLVAPVAPPPPPPPPTNTLQDIPCAMFAAQYNGTASGALEYWATALKKPNTTAITYMPQALGLTPNWGGDLLVWTNAGPVSGDTNVRSWMVSVGLCFNGITLTQAAAGGPGPYDASQPMDTNWATAFLGARFTTNVNNIIQNGVWSQANAVQMVDTIYVRPGWECTGNWYPWGSGASDQAASYALAFQRCVNIFRTYAAQPDANGKTVKIIAVFNPNGDYVTNGFNLDTIYPGDAYVDMIAIDIYDMPQWQGGLNASGQPNLSTTARFAQYQLVNLQAADAYAQAHGKMVGVCEWGAGASGDNPDFINGVATWAAAAKSVVGILGYWDGNADSGYNSQMEGQYPNQMAAYIANFGA